MDKELLRELESLRTFKKTFEEYELSKKQGFIAYENWLECEKEIKVLKQRIETFEELLKLYKSAYGFSQPWITMPYTHSQIDKLEKEANKYD